MKERKNGGKDASNKEREFLICVVMFILNG